MGRPRKNIQQENKTEKETIPDSVDRNNFVVYANDKYIQVDKKLFYELVYSLITGNTRLYTGMSGVVSLGKILGADTFEKQKSVCDAIVNEVVNSQKIKKA